MKPQDAGSSTWLPELNTESTVAIQEDGRDAADWRNGLLRTQKRTPSACLQNALVALREAPEWQGVLHFDESALRVVAKKEPPWASLAAQFPWSDQDDVLAAAWMQQQGIMVSKDIAGQAVQTVAREHPLHPIREYLNELVWDEIPRINDWLTSYLSVNASDYARAIGPKWLIGAVARVFAPGCKNDTCLVLEGPQGALKSTALRALAEPWFTDDISDLGTKDAAMQVRGVWILELAELDAMSRPEASRTKAFMSRSTDRYRPPYARHLIEVPRESVFAGTVNHDTYLKDETGGRRFWPAKCGTIRIDELRRDRDQLWAEAVVRFRAGDTWWIDSAELGACAADEQRHRYDEDTWQPLIAKGIKGLEHVTIDEILKNYIDKPTRDCSQGDKTRVARCLRALGWTRKRGPEDDNGHRDWRYCPGPRVRPT